MPRVHANGIEIFYEEQGPKDAEPLLMIMGIGTQLIHWPDELCDMLVERGFRIIRFDNRDMGLSTKLDWHGSPPLGAMFMRAMVGLRIHPPYWLNDMADDAVGLLDALGIESAHLFGVSMGGMIAQTVAIRHEARARTLTSLMSTTGERFYGKLSAYRALFGKYPKDREGALRRGVNVFSALVGPGYPLDEKRCRDLLERSLDRSPSNPSGFKRQMAAVLGSGNRVKELKQLKVPTLVMHGTADPLIPFAAGKATARAIPGAKLVPIEGLGHQMPEAVWPLFVDELAGHALAASPARS
jgi:pimeloyl-ACP methyl ester carboxylesterase